MPGYKVEFMTIKLLADASLINLSIAFPHPFELTVYTKSLEIPELLYDKEILLCRSTLKCDRALLAHQQLRFLATASSGNDHIDKYFLEKIGVKLVDARGCNANAVADYSIACITYLKRYHGFCGNKYGIIGCGSVGSLVASRLKSLGYQVICYDPPRQERDSEFISADLRELFECNLLSIHTNLHNLPPHPSVNLIDTKFLNNLPHGTVIINAARGDVVDESAIIHAIQQNGLFYCTDVYQNEPEINPMIVALATISTPHIAGHSIEGKLRAVTLVSEKLHNYYRLPPVGFGSLIKNNLVFKQDILDLYNPIYETRYLKNASHYLGQAFVELRKAHLRHDFSYERFDDYT